MTEPLEVPDDVARSIRFAAALTGQSEGTVVAKAVCAWLAKSWPPSGAPRPPTTGAGRP